MTILNAEAHLATINLIHFLVKNLKLKSEKEKAESISTNEFYPLNLHEKFKFDKVTWLQQSAENHFVKKISAGTLRNDLFGSFHALGPKIESSIKESYSTLKQFASTNQGLADLFTKFDLEFEKWLGMISVCPQMTQQQLKEMKLNKVSLNKMGSSNSAPLVSNPLFSSEEISKNILDSFANTTWISYERLDKKRIAAKKIEFGSFDGPVWLVEISYNYNGAPQLWQGTVSYNSVDGTLVIAVLGNLAERRGYVHYLIDVEQAGKKNEICIGHVTYKHPKNLNIVSKTTVIHKADNKESITARAYDLNDAVIPSEIAEFFEIRLLNRLSSPHRKSVTDLKSLRSWIDQKKYSKDSIHPGIFGSYKVFFKREPSEDEIHTGVLSIENEGPYNTKLSYKIGQEKSVVLLGRGYVDFVSKSFCVSLQLEQDQDELRLGSPKRNAETFLIIAIPSRDTDSVEALVGIATGVRDQNRGTVSRMMVFIKTNKDKLPTSFKQQIVKNFFSEFKNRSWIRPPISSHVPIVYRISHLVESKASSQTRRKK